MTYKVQINDEIRNATADEAARIDAQRAEAEAQAAAADAKAAALASARAKFAALGLNENEIAAIIGA
jgi:hypothetical protein